MYRHTLLLYDNTAQRNMTTGIPDALIILKKHNKQTKKTQKNLTRKVAVTLI